MTQQPYGVGLAYRSFLHDDVLRYAAEIDVLEIPTEDYIVRERRLSADPYLEDLRQAVETFPCIAHGISMSIGSVEPHDEKYLGHTQEFMKRFGIDTLSEHLAFHRMDGVDQLNFLAMPFDEVSLRWLQRKYYAARRLFGRPLALENVSYYFPVPECEMDEAQFLTRLTELTDCTLLLDVTNIYNNATNHGYDPVDFVRRLPAGRVSQLHLAGGHHADGMLQDSHSSEVFPEVWELFDVVLQETAADVVVLERDSNFYPFEALMDDIRKAREIFLRHRPASPRRQPAPANGGPLPAVDKPEPDAPEFADLKNFQRALLGEITNRQVQQAILDNDEKPFELFPMSEDWRSRWRSCDPARIRLLARKWQQIQGHREEQLKYYKNLEWSAWARGGNI